MIFKGIIKSILIFVFCFVQIQTSFAEKKPNIVIIITDQQFANAMSCVMGDQYLHTPNMDHLADKGVMFTRAYSPNPLCLPMRTSMVTGQFPHETGALTNSDKNVDFSNRVFIGKIFKDAGYETGYFGKWHIPLKENRKDIHGFDTFVGKDSQQDAEPAAKFIKQKHDKPFFVVASFLSPHEICQWSRFQETPGWPIEKDLPPLEELPPLKKNFQAPENEPDIMTYMRESYQAHRLFPVGDYTDADWRRLAWGYYRLIERADDFVGTVVSAIEESGQMENTIVVFLADHGDCAGSHHWNQKTVFYDESARVPFIVAWDGKTKKSRSKVLMNTGTDMIPTLCEFAGIKNDFGIFGESLYPVIMQTGKLPDRKYVVSENHMIQNEPVNGVLLQPHGRMVRSDNYKYCVYSEGENRESLVDMKYDPQEMINQAKNPVYKKVLEQHRNYLKKHAKQTNDLVAQEMVEKQNENK